MRKIRCFACGAWHTTYHRTPEDAVWPYCAGTPWCPDCCPRCKKGGSAYAAPLTPEEEEILGTCVAVVGAYEANGVFTPRGGRVERSKPSPEGQAGLGHPSGLRPRKRLHMEGQQQQGEQT